MHLCKSMCVLTFLGIAGYCYCSVAKPCLPLCDPMDCSTRGLPVHHQLLEPTQTHVHHVGDAIQPSHSLLSPSPPTYNLSQHQGLSQCQFFASGGQSTGVSASASVLPMNFQDWFPLEWSGWISLQSKGLSRVFSNTTVEKHQVFGIQLSYGPALSSICDYWKKHSFGYTDLCWTFGLFHIFDITNLNAMNNLVPVHL